MIYIAKDKKLGLSSTWSMAVGGMIGGGIFSVLGVTVQEAGNLTWLSFLIAGLIAFCTAISYSNLTAKFKESGGAFTYIKDINHKGIAGSLSWLLIIGYVLTIAVYSSTFGHYLSYAFGINGGVFRPVFSVGIILIFIAFNLKGAGSTSKIEMVSVWIQIIILLAIVFVGLNHFNLEQFISNSKADLNFSLIPATASIFMAYEGIQLITYDYDSIKKPDKTILRAEILAMISVIIIYIAISISAILLLGESTIIENKEVVIAILGRKAFGVVGFVLASIAALFSTSSAINSTLFSTAKLAKKVSDDKELPQFMEKLNKNQIPSRGVILIGALAAVLTTVGSLSKLVEGASFVFLITFAVVNLISFQETKKYKAISVLGLL
ncbi:MAG: APC family permease, partial [Pisciglobus halotolerans]|nr:APC family permease [Pisciglobus halotolerans]